MMLLILFVGMFTVVSLTHLVALVVKETANLCIVSNLSLLY